MINEFLNTVRRDFEGQDLAISKSPDQPVELFENWFEEAVEAQVLDPMAMNIATVDAAGQPSLRVVYLKKISEEGLTFFTDYERFLSISTCFKCTPSGVIHNSHWFGWWSSSFF